VTIDRYDELMLGLYDGTAPAWLTGASRELFLRESMRRRCELALALRTHWKCTSYLARCLYSDDFVLEVFRALPRRVSASVDTTAGLYVGLDQAFREAGAPGHLHELFTYESLAVNALSCAPRGARLSRESTWAVGLADAEVFGFATDVQAMWGRISMYSTAFAPAQFGKAHVPRVRRTWIARSRRAGAWVLEDVTGAIAGAAKRCARAAAN
jgi:hypothetical protein